ncbi:putative phospholipase A2 domain superfamily [Helianthus debilis subsp. tardiflorus]
MSEMISDKVDIPTTLDESSPKPQPFDVKFLGMSLTKIVPWAINTEKIRMPTFLNKKLKKHAQRSRSSNGSEPGLGYATVRFRPYVCKVPWHTGPRAFLSQLFPRYGHYCGPNWSSGKDGGSLLWDKRPIDWLDYCCYCHDMGYDTHDQAELLKADLAFLECLERPHMATKGDVRVAHLYKTMCISGLRSILIPYRQHLVKLKSGQLYLGFGWLSNMKWKGWNAQK